MLPPHVSDPALGGGQTWVGAGRGRDVVQDGVCGISGRTISVEYNETLSGEQASLGPLLLCSLAGLEESIAWDESLNTAMVLSLPTRPLSHSISRERAHFIRLQGSGLWVSNRRRK